MPFSDQLKSAKLKSIPESPNNSPNQYKRKMVQSEDPPESRKNNISHGRQVRGQYGDPPINDDSSVANSINSSYNQHGFYNNDDQSSTCSSAASGMYTPSNHNVQPGPSVLRNGNNNNVMHNPM